MPRAEKIRSWSLNPCWNYISSYNSANVQLQVFLTSKRPPRERELLGNPSASTKIFISFLSELPSISFIAKVKISIGDLSLPGQVFIQKNDKIRIGSYNTNLMKRKRLHDRTSTPDRQPGFIRQSTRQPGLIRQSLHTNRNQAFIKQSSPLNWIRLLTINTTVIFTPRKIFINL